MAVKLRHFAQVSSVNVKGQNVQIGRAFGAFKCANMTNLPASTTAVERRFRRRTIPFRPYRSKSHLRTEASASRELLAWKLEALGDFRTGTSKRIRANCSRR